MSIARSKCFGSSVFAARLFMANEGVTFVWFWRALAKAERAGYAWENILLISFAFVSGLFC